MVQLNDCYCNSLFYQWRRSVLLCKMIVSSTLLQIQILTKEMKWNFWERKRKLNSKSHEFSKEKFDRFHTDRIQAYFLDWLWQQHVRWNCNFSQWIRRNVNLRSRVVRLLPFFLFSISSIEINDGSIKNCFT